MKFIKSTLKSFLYSSPYLLNVASKIPTLFSNFPREVGNPNRVVVKSKEEFLEFVKKNLPFFNLYSSVYHFEKLNDFNGRIRPDYNSAVVDKIFLDLDGEKAYDYAIIIHEFLESKKIYHLITFSGGGFHIYIFTKPIDNESGDKKRMYLAAFCNYLEAKLDVRVDPLTIGDLTQMARIPNTYNFKRKKWCIPLTEKLLYSKPLTLYYAEKGQLPTYELFGSKYVDITKLPPKYYTTVFSNYTPSISYSEVEQILNSIDWEKELKIPIYLPPLIKKLIAKHKVMWDKKNGYWDRYIIILWFRENGLPLRETIKILKYILTPEEFKHCVMLEKQPFYIYSRQLGPNALFFPSTEWLEGRGYDLTEEDREAISNLYSFPSILYNIDREQ